MRHIFNPVFVISDNCYLQQKFSPNVIYLDIFGLGLLNLSFYDLLRVIN